MDDQSNIPVSLPRANPLVSYWQDPPSDIANLRSSSDLPHNADVVVIGSGISGACVAFNLLEQNRNVLMVEAREACSGATGRNGGHTKAASYRSFLPNMRSLGLAEAVKIARLEYENIKATQDFARKHGIDCDLFDGDTIDVIYDQEQWNEAVAAVEMMRENMPDDLDGAASYVFHTAEIVRERFFCQDGPLGGITYAAGSLSAYKFVIGILKLGLQIGLNLQTSTPALQIEKNETGWRVVTERGTILAKDVVLATNGYTAAICPKFQTIIVPLRGQVTAHRPGSNMPKDGLTTTYSFIYENGYEYMIPQPLSARFPGDIVMGGGLVKASDEGLYEYGNTDDTSLDPMISDYLYASTPKYFGTSWGTDHKDGRIRKEWTGIMGYSANGFPFVGAVDGQEGLWITASFQGHGMVLSFLCAKALVMLMGGVESSELKWFPAAFLMSKSRLEKTFQGRLHLKPTDVEVGGRI